MPFDRRGEVPRNEAPFFLNAVFNHHAGLVSSYISRRYVESSQRHPDAPRLTPLHVEALDLLDALAEDPDLHLDMEFRPGDLQLLHNPHHLPRPHRVRGLAGARSESAICSASGSVRRTAGQLPDRYAARWGSVAIGDRGGIVCPGTKLHAPLTPM